MSLDAEAALSDFPSTTARVALPAEMAAREHIESFWAAMRANDWKAAAEHLAEDCIVDWPCSGERIVGRSAFAAIQATYPTNTGRWSFDIHRLVADGDTAVSEITVSDGEQSARLVAISLLRDGLIAEQIEYWPGPTDPLPGREHLTQPIPRVP